MAIGHAPVLAAVLKKKSKLVTSFELHSTFTYIHVQDVEYVKMTNTILQKENAMSSVYDGVGPAR